MARGLPLDPAPLHDRAVASSRLPVGSEGEAAEGENPLGSDFLMLVTPAGEPPPPPEFLGVMPKIMGAHSSITILTKASMSDQKAKVSIEYNR